MTRLQAIANEQREIGIASTRDAIADATSLQSRLEDMASWPDAAVPVGLRSEFHALALILDRHLPTIRKLAQ